MFQIGDEFNFREDGTIWLDFAEDHLVVDTKYGWSLHVPLEYGLVEVNARLGRFMEMFTGHVPTPEEGEQLPLALVVARRHGIQALPLPMKLGFGHPN